MKKQLRFILILMVACILGINLFQGYWLYQSYRLKVDGLSRSVNEALVSALKQQHLKDADRTIRFHIDSLSGKHVSGNMRKRVGAKVISAGEEGHRISHWVADTTLPAKEKAENLFMFRMADSVSVDSAVFFADTLARELSSLLVLNRFYEREYNLGALDSIYAAELAVRGLLIPFQLDTLRLERPGMKTKSVIEDGRLYSSQVPVNTLSNLFVQASFSNSIPFVLKRMGKLIAASFFLFLLTTGCLVYMLQTILTQKRLSEIKSDFINNMTHELKTPIATVSAAVEALQHFDAMADKARTRDYLDISRRELDRLGNLVEKVLSIATEERRDLELHAEQVNVVTLIEQLVEQHRLRNDHQANLRFEHQLEDPFALVDKTHFTNAISNLIDNALKYSQEAEADILVRCSREEDWLRVSVKDKGIGIPRDYQKAIFEQFFRVPNGDLHEVKGFGLGLSYVKKIIEKHGGSVWVQSEVSKGAEFIIRIPVGRH